MNGIMVLLINGTETGGFTVTISTPIGDFIYPNELTFEEAIEHADIVRNGLGLPDECVLVNVEDVLKSKDKSVKLDATKKLLGGLFNNKK